MIQDIIYQGEDRDYQIIVRDGKNNLIDISQAQQISFSVAVRPGAPVLINRTIGNGITLNNNHQFTARLTSALTDALPTGNLRVQIRIQTSTGLYNFDNIGTLTVKTPINAVEV